jgi:phospholipase A1
LKRVTWCAAAVLALAGAPALAAPDWASDLSPGPAPAESFQIIHQGSGLSLHDEMFLLPFTHSDKYNGRKSEVVFQISGKQALFGKRFYVAYTQLSYWQAYDVNGSSPFRNTDYNPEFIYRLAPRPRGDGFVGGDIGIEHESNGQRDQLSRSWNQVYVAPHYLRDRLLVRLKLRWRIPEPAKETPTSAVGDDNPDINDYLGYADLNLYYRWSGKQQVHLLARGNVGAGHGYVSLNLSRPLPHDPHACLVFTLSHGYGESLLDYDSKVTRVGFGVMLAR